MAEDATTFEKQCILWVHNEAFAKEDVLFNASILPEGVECEGRPFTITSLNTGIGIRDFETQEQDVSEVQNLQTHTVEPSLVFIARDASEELKVKHPTLQVTY